MFNNDLSRSEIGLNNFNLNAYFIIDLITKTFKKSNTEFLLNNTSFTNYGKLDKINFQLTFSAKGKKLINKHKKMILYSALVMSKDNDIKKHSTSIAKEFILK